MLCEQHRLELWTDGVKQGVIDNMIVFQKPFPGAARTELESQLQRTALPLLGPRGVCAPQRGRALEARHVWLMGRQWGVLFEVRHLMLEPLKADAVVEGEPLALT